MSDVDGGVRAANPKKHWVFSNVHGWMRVPM